MKTSEEIRDRIEELEVKWNEAREDETRRREIPGTLSGRFDEAIRALEWVLDSGVRLTMLQKHDEGGGRR